MSTPVPATERPGPEPSDSVTVIAEPAGPFAVRTAGLTRSFGSQIAVDHVDLVVPRASFDTEWQALAQALAATAPGTTRAVKSVVGAAIPMVQPELQAGAANAFARLWTADAHWDAVDAMTAARRQKQ